MPAWELNKYKVTKKSSKKQKSNQENKSNSK